MKNKGFTLVEMLAVIVLLSIIALIAVPAITGIIKGSKETLSEAQLKSIENSARNWASDIDNVDKLPTADGTCVKVSLNLLKKEGYANLDIKDPKTGNQVNAWVKITRSGKKLNYETRTTNFTGCTDAEAL